MHLPVSDRRQPIRIKACDTNRVVVTKHIPENHRPNLIPRHPMRRDPIQFLLLQRSKKALHPGVVITMMHTAQALDHAHVSQLFTKCAARILAATVAVQNRTGKPLSIAGLQLL